MDDPSPGRRMRSPRQAALRVSLYSNSPGGAASSDEQPGRMIRSPRSGPLRVSLSNSPRRFRSPMSAVSPRLDDDSSVDLRTRSGFASEDFLSDDGSASRRSVRFLSGPIIPPGERILGTDLLSPRERTRRDDAAVRMRESNMRRVLTKRRLMEQDERLRRQQEAAEMNKLRERARHLREVRKSLDIQERALRRSMRAAEVKQRHNETERKRQEDCASIAQSSAVRCASVAAASLCERARVSQRRRAGSLSQHEQKKIDREEDRKLRSAEHIRLKEEKRLEEERARDFQLQIRETTEAARKRRIEEDHHKEETTALEVRAAKEYYAEQLRREKEEQENALKSARRFAARQREKEAVELRELCEAPPPPKQIGDDEYKRLCLGRYKGQSALHRDPAGDKIQRTRPRFAPRWRPPSFD
eukprot:Hpha_TRINITY_DN35083_c0_g1::TRINITY_DN35083_c0_g1_i1::g.82782::m.82782